MLRRHAAVLATMVLATVASPVPAQAHTSAERHSHGTSTLPDRFDPCSKINYMVNAAQAKQGALEDVKTAIARVQKETGLTFRYAGTTKTLTNQPYPADVQLIVEWVKPGQGGMDSYQAGDKRAPAGLGGYSLGTGYLKDGRTAGHILEGAVSINSARQSYSAGFGSTDPRKGRGGSRGQLLVQTIGHAIGMQSTNNPADLMHGRMSHRNVLHTAVDKKQFRAAGKAGGCIYGSDPTYRPAPTQVPEPSGSHDPTEPLPPEPGATDLQCYRDGVRVPCDSAGFPEQPSLRGAPGGSSLAPAGTPALAAQAFDLVNAERVEAGRARLKWIDCANTSAQKHTQVQAELDRMHHQTGDALLAACDGSAGAGENVAWGTYRDAVPSRIVGLWMGSQGHRENILYDRYTHAGMGYVKAANGKHYFTQVFVIYD